ncbi:MAG: SDR family NAD(P)-dependent oxidoreductase [Dermatophilaceae bacterium]
MNSERNVALITGGSAGLGRELAHRLADQGWSVVITGRRAGRVEDAVRPGVHPVRGDVGDADHRSVLVDMVTDLGRLDLLVNNASTLGPTPLPLVADLPPGALDPVWRTNVDAPIDLLVRLLPALAASGGVAVSVSSDAAVEHYPGWGAYGASKAALEHLTLTVAAENPEVPIYVIDPGDMRTEMHQEAFPGQDISDRPLPATVVPGMLALLARRPLSGRYRVADLAAGDLATAQPVAEPDAEVLAAGMPVSAERAVAERVVSL